ncbi:MAG: hypothetical protein WC504_14185 [Methylobacter sp.]|jgi:hypothetical protein
MIQTFKSGIINMYTLYKINSDELNENFIAAVKAQFPHQTIEISISEISQVEQDETAYLLGNPANKARLLAAIAQAESNQLIDVDIDKL